MYRKVDDFLQEWKNEANLTKSVLDAVSDEKLGQAIEEGIIHSVGSAGI